MWKNSLKMAVLAGGVLVPGIAAAAASAIVTTDLNVRTGPSTAYPAFDVIPNGGNVTVYGCLSGYDWCDIEWAGYRGWVSGNYLAYLGERYYRRPISSIGISIGLPVIGFNRNSYYDRWYDDDYFDRWVRSEIRDERREDRREVRRDRREDRREIREERREDRRATRRDRRRDNRQDARQEQREDRPAVVRQDRNPGATRTRDERAERRAARQDRREDRRENREERRQGGASDYEEWRQQQLRQR